jgi:hypothetical protein
MAGRQEQEYQDDNYFHPDTETGLSVKTYLAHLWSLFEQEFYVLDY